MLTLRTLAIVITGAGVFAGLPLTGAQACDDDRYPCPIRAEAATQETAPAQAAPSAQPQRKASHAARPTAKAQAKPEREAPRAAARAKPSKPAAPEQAADSIAPKGAEAAPAMVAAPAMAPSSPADQPLNDESRTESPVATAATAWPVFPATEGVGARAPGATSADATEAAKTNAVANAVQVVDPNEVNDLDRAAAATVPAESSWITYLLLILGAALAAASAFWFFSSTTSLFARRAANPRMHMSNS